MSGLHSWRSVGNGSTKVFRPPGPGGSITPHQKKIVAAGLRAQDTFAAICARLKADTFGRKTADHALLFTLFRTYRDGLAGFLNEHQIVGTEADAIIAHYGAHIGPMPRKVR